MISERVLESLSGVAFSEREDVIVEALARVVEAAENARDRLPDDGADAANIIDEALSELDAALKEVE